MMPNHPLSSLIKCRNANKTGYLILLEQKPTEKGLGFDIDFNIMNDALNWESHKQRNPKELKNPKINALREGMNYSQVSTRSPWH